MMAVCTLLPELAWNVGVLAGLLFDEDAIALAEYMFDDSSPRSLRAPSLFHVALPPLMLWMLHRLSFDRRTLPTERPRSSTPIRGRSLRPRPGSRRLPPPAARSVRAASGTGVDHVFIERLWRGVEYGAVYLKAYEDGRALEAGLTRYFALYNARRVPEAASLRDRFGASFQSDAMAPPDRIHLHPDQTIGS